MCDPASIGVGLQMFGTYQQGKAAQSQANYAASVANQNAALSIEQANDVQRQKAEEQSMLKEQGRQMRGRQLTGMAGAGIDSSTGSGLDILTDSAYTTQQDVNQTEYNAARKSWAYQQESENYKAEASANKAAGKNAMTSAYIGMASTLLSSMGNVDDKWKQKGQSKGGYKPDTSSFFPKTGFEPKPGFGFNNPLKPTPKYTPKYGKYL